MATKEEDFKQRFVAIMQDLQDNANNDPEAMWLVGSLACRLIDKVKARSWAEFKATMSPRTYNMLLTDLQREGNRQHREGDYRKAYAMQVIGVSLIAPTQADPQMQVGNKLLDEIVERMVKVFRDSQKPTPNGYWDAATGQHG